jgi:signal transduction histidine kinase/HPt (histidine-containing phosphotransfer) domain-containing protein/AmiR/NasT family two-component response regulator
MRHSQLRRPAALVSFWLALLASVLLCAWPAQAAIPQVVLADSHKVDLNGKAALYEDRGEAFPATAAEVAPWEQHLMRRAGINLLGGKYWLVAQLRNDSADPQWVFDPNDTVIEQVQARWYGADGTLQQLHTGYHARHEFMLHYGKRVTLAPGATVLLVVRMSSPYFARQPVLDLTTLAAYEHRVASENFQIIASLGALVALAVFNFFIFSFTRDRSPLYYSMYVLCYALAWAMAFNVTAELLDWHELRLHYVPFFLLPVLSTLFYRRFLRLKQRFPRLERISRVNFILPLLLMPSSWFALSYAHTLATIAITVWITLALVCGVAVWRHGYQPARYFVLAFVALLVPGLLILPANVGLVPAMVDNAQLFTLLGGTLDGVLLAFGMADQIRLLRNNLQGAVSERTRELTEANAALLSAKEQAEQVSRHRIEFLAAMSHDIRTPLAGVLGMLKFALRDRSVQGRTQEYLRIGLDNGESLMVILNDILDFSKIDAGKLTLETIDFRLSDLVDDAVRILQGQADAKSLLLRRELGDGLPAYVVGDPTRIRQMLLNLLGNAIKFTERGEVRLAVHLHAEGDGHAVLLFSVIDTGPGIAPEVRQRLFQKFEQADHSTTRRYGGTGLGLAICKQLVTLMHGDIWVRSEVGAGSCFTFRLPLPIGSAPPMQAAPKARARHLHRLHVLCAEDVRTNQIIISTLLENMGHQVRMVEHGLAAIDALAETDFDLVLMDGRMPIMDGEQATRLIRGGGFEGRKVRNNAVTIIALTANASEMDSARYLASGMNGFLSKPLDEQLLFDQIEATIASLLARGRSLPPNAGPEPGAVPASEDELARQFGVEPPEAPGAGLIRFAGMPGLSAHNLERLRLAFVEETPRRVALARSALDARDADAAAGALHALKGSAAYLSSQQLHELAHRLEALAIARQFEEMESLFAPFTAAAELAVGDLRAAMAGHAPAAAVATASTQA